MRIPKRMIEDLRHRFPGKTIICIPPDRPTEVICEIEKDPDGKWSVAVALIGKSNPHWHLRTHESYRVVSGAVQYFDGISVLGKRLDAKTPFESIRPSTVHWAKGVGRPAEVLVVASPAWTPGDHHLRTDIKF